MSIWYGMVLKKQLTLGIPFGLQRIAELVPYAAYEPLIPEKTAPDYKYSAEADQNLPGHEVAQKAVEAVKRKCTAADLLQILNDLPA